MTYRKLLFLLTLISPLTGCAKSEREILKEKISKLKQDFSSFEKELLKTQNSIQETEKAILASQASQKELRQKNQELEKKNTFLDGQVAYIEEKSTFLKALLDHKEKESEYEICTAKKMSIHANISQNEAFCAYRISQYNQCKAKKSKRAGKGALIGVGLAFFTGGASLLLAAGGAAAGALSKKCKKKPNCLILVERIKAQLEAQIPICSKVGVQPSIDGKMLVSPYAYSQEKDFVGLAQKDQAILTQFLGQQQSDPEELARILYSSKPSKTWLQKLTIKQLRMLRNLPYALGGAKFKTRSIKDFFSTQYWYKPLRSSKQIALHDNIKKNESSFWDMQKVKMRSNRKNARKKKRSKKKRSKKKRSKKKRSKKKRSKKKRSKKKR